MHSIIHKVEAASEARHLVVLGYVDSDWSKIGLSKIEHDFVTSKLAIGGISIHINQYSRVYLLSVYRRIVKEVIILKARERGAKLVKQFNEAKIQEVELISLSISDLSIYVAEGMVLANYQFF